MHFIQGMREPLITDAHAFGRFKRVSAKRGGRSAKPVLHKRGGSEEMPPPPLPVPLNNDRSL